MFDGIDDQRVLAMTDQEKRWFENIKKAFYESDSAFQRAEPQDGCLQGLLKAIDVAKTLRRSLRGEDTSFRENKDRFIEFLALEVPCFGPNEPKIELREGGTGKVCKLNYGEIVYSIRCSMVHEGENLNAAEAPGQHILLDWSVRNPRVMPERKDDQIVLNGYFFWNRLREVLAKFITGIQGMIDFVEKKSFSISIRPDLGSIKPDRPH
jgi:hypothetical protein